MYDEIAYEENNMYLNVMHHPGAVLESTVWFIAVQIRAKNVGRIKTHCVAQTMQIDSLDNRNNIIYNRQSMLPQRTKKAY